MRITASVMEPMVMSYTAMQITATLTFKAVIREFQVGLEI